MWLQFTSVTLFSSIPINAQEFLALAASLLLFSLHSLFFLLPLLYIAHSVIACLLHVPSSCHHYFTNPNNNNYSLSSFLDSKTFSTFILILIAFTPQLLHFSPFYSLWLVCGEIKVNGKLIVSTVGHNYRPD